MHYDSEAPILSEGTTGHMAPRSKRIILAVLTAVFAFAGLGAWALASPVGAAPDDDFHLASIWCSLGDRDGLCAEGDEPAERTVAERLVKSSACFKSESTQSAQCPIGDERKISTDRGNFDGNYPPVFYSVMGVFATPDVAVSTIIMRLVNAGIFVGAVTAVLALLQSAQRGPVVWSAVVTLVPLGVFLIPSVNPSSWAVLAGLLVWVSVFGYFTAETRTRRIALGAIACVLGVMGAGARGDSAVFVAFAAFAAMVLSFRPGREWMKLAILPLALMVVGAFFFLVSGQSTGIATVGVTGDAGATAAAAAAEATGDVTAAPPGGFGLLLSNLMDLPWLWTGGTGTWGLGWLDTPVPVSVWVLMIGALFALLLWGIQKMNWRKGIVLLVALVALAVMPLYILQSKALRVGEWVQPRYLLPLLIIFIGVALLGFARDDLGLSRLQAAVIFGAVAMSNSLALHNNMRRYISGLGDAGFNLNANIEWWWNIPLSPMLVWFGGSAAFALMLVGLWLWLYPKGERPGASLEERSPELIGK